MKKRRRILEAFVSFMLLIGLLPLPVSAEGPDGSDTKVIYGDGYLYANGVPIYIKEDGIYAAEENEGIYTAGDKITVYQAADSNAALTDDEVKASITSALNIYGGSNNTTVNGNTLIVLGGVNTVVATIYGGGRGSDSAVNGICNVVIQDTAKSINIYGGSYYGASNGVNIMLNTASGNASATKSVNGGGYGDTVNGDVNIHIKEYKPKITALYCGSRAASSSITGDMNVKISDSSYVLNCFGGGDASSFGGNISITIDGGAAISALFYPLGKTIASTTAPSIEGTATLNLPSDFDLSTIGNIPASKEDDVIINLCNKEEIISSFTYGTYNAPDAPEDTKITTDGSGTYYANGVNTIIKKNPSDNKVNFYDKFGTAKLPVYNEDDLDSPILDYSIEADAVLYGGSNNVLYDGSTKIAVDNVSVGTVFGAGSGENGGVKGNTIIVLNNANADFLYGGSDSNLSASPEKSIIMLKGHSAVAEHIYPCGILDQTGNCSGSEVIVPIEERIKSEKYHNEYINFFNPDDADSIIQADVSFQAAITINGTVMGTGAAPIYPSGAAPAGITSELINNELYVFLNGVAAVIQGDSEGTYLYDAEGGKIYDTPVDNARIFGGSKGTVVASSGITMEGGAVSYVYGGGYGGEVGTSTVTINDGIILNSLYGGGKNNGSRVAVTKDILAVVNGGSAKAINASDDGVTGNADFIMNGGIYQGLYAGNKSATLSPVFNTVTGDVSFTVNGGTFTALYGGSAAGIVQGDSALCINGGFMSNSSSSNIYPLGKTSAGSDVLGTATVYHYKGFDTSWIQDQDSAVIIETDKESSTIDLLAGYVQNKDAVLSTENDTGNLVFRFFEMMLPSESRDTITRTVAGDCTLITFPNGNTMLVDSGTSAAASTIISDLRAMGIEHLDYIALSHYHDDHAGGIPAIMAAFEVGELWLPSYEMDSELAPTTYLYYQRVLDAISAYNLSHETDAAVKNLADGDVFTIGENNKPVTISVLHPSGDLGAEDLYDHATINGASVVFRVEYGDTSALMTGDIFVKEESELIQKYPDLIDVDLLKVPHHAYTTSNSVTFIQATSPDAAVAMHLQQYNAPQLTIKSRYANSGVDFYQTAIYGMVKATLDGEKVSMLTEWYLNETPGDPEPGEGTAEKEESEEEKAPVPVTKGGVTTSTVQTENYGSDTHNKTLISKTALNQAIRTAVAAAAAAGTTPQVEIKPETTKQAKEMQVSVPVASLQKIAGSTVENLSIVSQLAAIAFTRDALIGIASQAKYDTLKIVAGTADFETLADEVKARIGNAAVYEFSIMNGTAPISSFGGGKATVTIPYALEDGENTEDITVWYIGSDKTLQKVEGAKYDAKSKTVTFETTHFSTYAVTAAPVKESGDGNTAYKSDPPIPDTSDRNGAAAVLVLLVLAGVSMNLLKVRKVKLPE